MDLRMRHERRAFEEAANAGTHAAGLFLSLVGAVLLIVAGAHHGTVLTLAACAIYGVSLVALYAASTFYHLETKVRRKHRMRMFDHIGIYLLIAGTYTPFALVVLQGTLRWVIFSAVWAIAIAGISMKVFHSHRATRLSLASYLLMGWLALFIMPALWNSLPPAGFWLLVAGGALYTGGTWFFARDRRLLHHAVWHLFVLGGSIMHFCSIYFFALRN